MEDELKKKKFHVFMDPDSKKSIVLNLTWKEYTDRFFYRGSMDGAWIEHEGEMYKYDLKATARLRYGKSNHVCGTYPYPSEALGVNPKQVPDMLKFDAQQGVSTNYDSEGRPVFTSKGHRRAYCKAHGYVDRNAGYSDPQ